MADWKRRETLILSGAPDSDVSYVADLLQHRPNMNIVCADAGIRHLHTLGIMPDLIVGDFDSSTRPALPCELIGLIPEKDDTDTMHALQVIIDRGCTSVWIVCATGGRIDHLLSNLSLCEYAYERGCACRIVDRQNIITFMGAGTVLLPYDSRYPYFSIIPLDSCLKDVTIRGAKYPTDHAAVTRTQIYTVSNEVTGQQAEITIGQGRALLIRSVDAR